MDSIERIASLGSGLKKDVSESRSAERTIVPTRVLLVEDDPVIAETVGGLLAAFGYVVCGTFDSGEQAIAGASALSPDIILMDINLNGEMDGIEAAETISATHDAPVIFMSGSADPKTRERAAGARNSGYLTKPFYPEALPLMIESTLRDSRTQH